MFETYDDMLTVEEVCDALKMGRGAIYQLLDDGHLKGIRNGRVWRIPKRSVIDFICEATTQKKN